MSSDAAGVVAINAIFLAATILFVVKEWLHERHDIKGGR